jgi:hypothetical protein
MRARVLLFEIAYNVTGVEFLRNEQKYWIPRLA